MSLVSNDTKQLFEEVRKLDVVMYDKNLQKIRDAKLKLGMKSINDKKLLTKNFYTENTTFTRNFRECSWARINWNTRNKPQNSTGIFRV